MRETISEPHRSATPLPVRASLGTAAVLGLLNVRVAVAPTTAYLMVHSPGRCSANCAFCTQARESRARSELLSRVVWPTFDLASVARALSKAPVKRACIQTVIYRGFLEEVIRIVSAVSGSSRLPISAAINPLSIEELKALRDAGVERIGIGLDAASPSTFERVKGKYVGGPFSWERAMGMIDDALAILGRGFVTCHLIYGLGDTDEDFLGLVERLHRKGVRTSLFAFTPVKGIPMEKRAPPSVRKYRAAQLAHHLITNGLASIGDLAFEDGALARIDVDRKIIEETVQGGSPFVTKGCPGCNRPFYNEPPGGPLYNYPSIGWALRDIGLVKRQLSSVLGVGDA